jgi:uncharacterized membrane protein
MMRIGSGAAVVVVVLAVVVVPSGGPSRREPAFTKVFAGEYLDSMKLNSRLSLPVSVEVKVPLFTLSTCQVPVAEEPLIVQVPVPFTVLLPVL